MGLAGLEQIVAAAEALPVIAIGGISADRVREVRASGAYGVAAIRALWDDAEHESRAEDAGMDVVINGERKQVTRGTTLLELLKELELDPRAVVVEHNARIVRRAGLGEVTVAEGDAIELVHFVGGG